MNGRCQVHELQNRPASLASALSNILSSLVRTGVLESALGMGGGFRMARSPKVVFLQEVLEPFESALGSARRAGLAVKRSFKPLACNVRTLRQGLEMSAMSRERPFGRSRSNRWWDLKTTKKLGQPDVERGR